MRVLEGKQVILRIFTGESNKYKGKPLYHSIVETLRKENIAGATVLRGITGFGAKSRMHDESLLALSQNLPVVIEVVDSREQIERVLPIIDEMMDHGLITMEDVHVIRYAPKK